MEIKNKRDRTIQRYKNISYIFICLGVAMIILIFLTMWLAPQNGWLMPDVIPAILVSMGLVMVMIGFIFYAIASEMMVQDIFKKWEGQK